MTDTDYLDRAEILLKTVEACCDRINEDADTDVDNQRVDLTAREFSLLALLVKRAGRVVTRSEILAQVWEMQHDPGSNVIDVHIRNLREKLGAAARCIETIRGQGYLFAIPAQQAQPDSTTSRPPEPRSGGLPAVMSGRPDAVLSGPNGPVILSGKQLPDDDE